MPLNLPYYGLFHSFISILSSYFISLLSFFMTPFNLSFPLFITPSCPTSLFITPPFPTSLLYHPSLSHFPFYHPFFSHFSFLSPFLSHFPLITPSFPLSLFSYLLCYNLCPISPLTSPLIPPPPIFKVTTLKIDVLLIEELRSLFFRTFFEGLQKLNRITKKNPILIPV